MVESKALALGGLWVESKFSFGGLWLESCSSPVEDIPKAEALDSKYINTVSIKRFKDFPKAEALDSKYINRPPFQRLP